MTIMEQRADDIISLLTMNSDGLTMSELCHLLDRRPSSVRPALTRARGIIAKSKQHKGQALVCVRAGAEYRYLIVSRSGDALEPMKRNGNHIKSRIESEKVTLAKLADTPIMNLALNLLESALNIAEQHVAILRDQALPHQLSEREKREMDQKELITI